MPDAASASPETNPASAKATRTAIKHSLTPWQRRLSPTVRSRRIVYPRQPFADKEGRQSSPHLERSRGRQMTRIELQRNFAAGKFIAAAVVANRIVDRQIRRALVGDDPAQDPVTLANSRSAHGAGDRWVAAQDLLGEEPRQGAVIFDDRPKHGDLQSPRLQGFQR